MKGIFAVMMRSLFIFMCFLSLSSSAQEECIDLGPEYGIVLDEEPTFPEGTAALNVWLSENLRYPAKDQAALLEGKVYVSFVVEADGSLSDFKVERGISPDMDAECRRLVSIMPKWIPGKLDNRSVASRFRMPIKFSLSDPH